MKNKALILIISLLFCIVWLSSCGKDSGGGTDEDKMKIMLTCSEGVSVTSANPVYAKPGETVTFSVELQDGYVFANLNYGTYDNGTVTVEGMTESKVIKLYADDLGYSTSEEYRFYFNGEDGDTVSISSSKVFGGDVVTVSANETYKTFLGWSFGARTVNSAEMFSTDREYTFRISPNIANDDKIVRIYANYGESGVYYYDLNGGEYNTGTDNTKDNKYYVLSKMQEKIKVTMSGDYLDVFAAVPLFWDDGSFTRAGYVLKEYNTEPDGTGDGYSPGSRYLIERRDGVSNVLYCIWERAEEEYFSYKAFNYPCPTTAARATHWHEEGIMITYYSGNEKTVAVPEMIDGKYVTGIAKGAFSARSFDTLVLPRTIQRIEKNAFMNCPSLETVYLPDSIYDMSNESFDEASYTSLKNIYVGATMAPRNASAYSVKLSRLMETKDSNRVIVIAGSSVYQGLSSEYLGALLEGEYEVINFGTTRTTHGLLYLEAMSAFAHEGDIILYAPENSSYMLGERHLYWKTLRDMESFYNVYRYVDFSNYENIFSAFADYNQRERYTKNPTRFEASYDGIVKDGHSINEYGEYQRADRTGLASKYIDSYHITLNNRVKSRFEAAWDDEDVQEATKDYNDPENITWASIDSPELMNEVNRVIAKAKTSGAKIYFSFCPVDADKVVPEAQNTAWMRAYDALIADIYDFDGVLGKSSDYVFAHVYFYDNAFHLNDVGRAYRTYRVYLDLAELLGIEDVSGFTEFGTDFEGCIFEGTSGVPQTSVPYIK